MNTNYGSTYDHLTIILQVEKSLINQLRDAQYRGASSAEIYSNRRRLARIRAELQALTPTPHS